MVKANDNVTVGNTTTQVRPAFSSGKFLILSNNSNQTMYLSLGAAAVMNKGIRLNPNGSSFVLGEHEFVGQVNGICGSGSKVLCYTEG